MSARRRGWGPGWPNCQWDRFTTLVRADGLRLPVRDELVDLVALLLDLTELSGYDVLPGQTWGVACRPISGTNTASNHSWGLAVDINAPSNPYASRAWHTRNARGTRPFGLAVVCDIPQQVVELWEAHGFRWGGRYNSKPDPMHFEQMGTPAEVAEHTRRLRAFLAAEGDAPPAPPEPAGPAPKPDPAPGGDTVTVTMTLPVLRERTNLDTVSEEERKLQRQLHDDCGQDIEVDGLFGPATTEAVQNVQRFFDIEVDGIVGKDTWGVIAMAAFPIRF